MPLIRSPQTPYATGTVEEAFRRAKHRTPVLDDGRETSSKEECEFLMAQGWGGRDQELVERKRQRQIQEDLYWKLWIGRQFSLAAEQVSNAELMQLQKTTKTLNGLLSDLGVAPDDIEDARSNIPASETEFWNSELGVWKSFKEETEQSDEQSTSTRTSPSPEPRQPSPLNVLASRSINCPSSPLRGVQKARVQKRRPKSHGWTKKKRNTKVPEQQEPPLARDGEPGPSAFLKPASGKGTTMTASSEGAPPSARNSRRRAGANAANRPHRPARVQKPAQKERTKPATTREYSLRDSTITKTRESNFRKPASTKKHKLRSKPTRAV